MTVCWDTTKDFRSKTGSAPEEAEPFDVVQVPTQV